MPTSSPDAPTTTVSPLTETELPNRSPAAPSEVIELRRLHAGRPAAARLDEDVRRALSTSPPTSSADAPTHDRVAVDRDRVPEGVTRRAVRGGELGRLGGTRPRPAGLDEHVGRARVGAGAVAESRSDDSRVAADRDGFPEASRSPSPFGGRQLRRLRRVHPGPGGLDEDVGGALAGSPCRCRPGRPRRPRCCR